MQLAEYLCTLTTEERRELADSLGISGSQLSQYANGHRRISADLAIEIERLTFGAVLCEEMRPQTNWRYLRRTHRHQAAAQ